MQPTPTARVGFSLPNGGQSRQLLSQPESPISPNLPKQRRVLDRPGNRKRIEALILEGLSDGAIARQMKVTRQAITAFRHRNAAEVAATVAVVEKQIEDLALGNKEARIRERAWLYGLARKEAEDYGITIAEERREYKRGYEEPNVIITRDFRGAMVKEMRGLLHDIAEELGQLPKASDLSVNVHVGPIEMLLNGKPADEQATDS